MRRTIGVIGVASGLAFVGCGARTGLSLLLASGPGSDSGGAEGGRDGASDAPPDGSTRDAHVDARMLDSWTDSPPLARHCTSTVCESSGWCACFPQPTGDELSSVWMDSEDDIWMTTEGCWVLRYDGKTWTNTNPDCTFGPAIALWGFGPTDVWAAAGSRHASTVGEILHWDGTTWSVSLDAHSQFTCEYGFPCLSTNAVWGSSSSDVWAAASGGPPAFVAGALLHFDGTEWTETSTIGGQTAPGFFGLRGTGPSDVWAVGGYADETGSSRAPVAHWDGKSWTLSEVRGPAILTSVWGAASDDVWAVGDGAIHWDGTSWSEVAGLAPLASTHAVWGASSSEVWAVGGDEASDPQMARWQGKSWKTLAPLSPKEAPELNGIAGTGPSDVLAVGTSGSMVRWNGTGLSTTNGGVPAAAYAPNVALGSIWGSGPDDIWAGSFRGPVVHWDGRTWKTAPVEGEVVWGTGASDVWVAAAPAFRHWDGSKWTSVGAPTGEVAQLWGSGPNDVWAVYQEGFLSHWDGSRWSRSKASPTMWADAIWGSSATDVWLVGEGADSPIEHWDGSRWASVPVPGSSGFQKLTAVWGTGSDDVWAAGVWESTHGPPQSAVIAYHWDGSAWKRHQLDEQPSTTYQVAGGLWGRGSSDIWLSAPASEALGPPGHTGVLFHYDGTTWTHSSSEVAGAIWGTSDGIYALGSAGILYHP